MNEDVNNSNSSRNDDVRDYNSIDLDLSLEGTSPDQCSSPTSSSCSDDGDEVTDTVLKHYRESESYWAELDTKLRESTRELLVMEKDLKRAKLQQVQNRVVLTESQIHTTQSKNFIIDTKYKLTRVQLDLANTELDLYEVEKRLQRIERQQQHEHQEETNTDHITDDKSPD